MLQNELGNADKPKFFEQAVQDTKKESDLTKTRCLPGDSDVLCIETSIFIILGCKQ